VRRALVLISACLALTGCSDNSGPAPPVVIDAFPGPGAVDPLGRDNPIGRAAEPTVDETASRFISRLARKYQPSVVVARADRFWPVSVQTVLGYRAGGKTTCLHSDKSCRQAPTLADLSPGAGKDDWLIYPGSPKKAQDHFQMFAEALGIGASLATNWINDVAADPSGSAQMYFFGSRNVPKTDPPLPPTLLNLQYWFFYPFNYLPVQFRALGQLGVDPAAATKHNLDYHEGDFEHISVLLRPVKKGARVAYEPRYVFMARHADEGVLFDWESPALSWEGQDRKHPVVYAGFGGHASYESCGPHPRQLSLKVGQAFVGATVTDYGICTEPLVGSVVAPVGGVFTFGPKTPLVELRRNSWACWRGRFGRVPEPGRLERKLGKLRRTLNLIDALAQIQPLQPGPEAPLRQGENKGECVRSGVRG
jgi:hypothetical protein